MSVEFWIGVVAGVILWEVAGEEFLRWLVREMYRRGWRA